MLIEELAELIVAINKYDRYGREVIQQVIEEIADVKIMIEQIELMFNINKQVRKEMGVKLGRLSKMI